MTFPDYLGEPATLPGRKERARPAVIRDWRFAEWLAVVAVCLGAFTSQLDNGVVTVAYPRLVHELHRPLSQVAWIGMAPFVTIVATLLLFGRRADTVGRKRVYVDGFVFFLAGAAGSFFCVRNFPLLLISRIVEALGVAMVQANSVALITASVRHHQRSTALGIQAAAQAIGLAVGPLFGSLLLAHVSWRYLFLLSAPMAFVALCASTLFLPRTRGLAQTEPLDVAGSGVLALAAAGLLGGLTIAAKEGWSGLALGLFVTGLSASFALLPIERRAKAPLFHPRLFRHASVRRSLGLLIVTYVTFFGLLVVIPFFATHDFHASVTRASEATMAIPLGLACVAPLSGRLRRRVSDSTLLRVATVLVATSVTAMVVAPNGKVVAGLLFFTGVGIGIGNTTNNALVMEGVQVVDRGVASGTVNLARAAGSAIGMALSTAVLVLLESNHVHTIRPAVAALAVLGVVGVGLSLRRLETASAP